MPDNESKEKNTLRLRKSFSARPRQTNSNASSRPPPNLAGALSRKLVSAPKRRPAGSPKLKLGNELPPRRNGKRSWNQSIRKPKQRGASELKRNSNWLRP